MLTCQAVWAPGRSDRDVSDGQILTSLLALMLASDLPDMAQCHFSIAVMYTDLCAIHCPEQLNAVLVSTGGTMPI